MSVERGRVGFFKVGVLPLLVLESLDLEILNSAEMPRLEDSIRELASAPVQHGVEIRNFSLRCEAPGCVSISAGVARLRRGRWKLADVCVTRDGAPVRHSEAALRFAGTGAVLSAPGMPDVALFEVDFQKPNQTTPDRP